jgi:uncharacterized protein (DUF1501 family)
MDRRNFIAALAAASVLPACAGQQAMAPQAAAPAVRSPRGSLPRSAGLAGDVRGRILVLVELHGGNDGINTVIPISQPAYKRLRPGLAIGADEALDVTPDLAFHPALRPLMDPFERGEIAVLHGVGYPKPNRSHFRSIEIWEQATPSDQYGTEGWITRGLRDDPLWGRRQGDADAVAIGQGNVGPLAGPDTRLVTMRDPRQFLAQSETLRAMQARDFATPALAHIVRTQNEAVAAAEAVKRKLSGRERFSRRFGGFPLGRAMATTADLIADGVDAPVWKVQLGGFDTHADQLGRHQRLLTQLAGSLAALRASMIELGRWNDTLVMTYSEFGRRAAENLSRGTDHGAAAPLFLMGGAIEGGFKGERPDLEKLVEGDLDAKIDFRTIYASVLADWWGQRQNFLVQQGQTPMPLIRARTGAGV